MGTGVSELQKSMYVLYVYFPVVYICSSVHLRSATSESSPAPVESESKTKPDDARSICGGCLYRT
jgi:hypothetical protein